MRLSANLSFEPSMSFTRNGNPGPRPTVRYRLDGRAGTGLRLLGKEHGSSGRRLVLAGVASILALWGLLYLVFIVWRSDYRQLADYGVREVLPALDPLARLQPPGIRPGEWAETIDATRAMVKRITSSGALDRSQMEALRAELATVAGRSRPETAVSDLVGLWSDMEDRAGPLLADTAYPRLLAPALVAGRLASVVPSNVDRVSWTNAVRDTQEMLVAAVASNELTPGQYDELVQDLRRAVAGARPSNVQARLGEVWSKLATEAPRSLGRSRRPSVLAAPSDRESRSK